MINNPGRPITIYNIGEMVGNAFPLAFTPSNVTKGFVNTGIWPFKDDAFSEEDFLMCSVTDREMAEPENNISVENRNISITNQDEISLVEIASNSALKNDTLQEVQKFCSPHLYSFWECLNATFVEISRGEHWSGRICCPLPLGETCKRACVTATSISELSRGCRRSDEIAFFSCLERQETGDTCCGQATNDACRMACVDIFRTATITTPTKRQRTSIMEHCHHSSPEVLACMKNYTRLTPATDLHKHMHCCDKSNKIQCREACKKVLSNQSTFQEIIDSLHTGGCGPPLPQDYFWQCFLKPAEPVTTSVEVSRIDRVGMDSAKWHCCQRASSNQCRKLCSRTFTKDWATSWDEFHYKCLSQATEEQLRNCIDEVDEPCELGCDGLSFCTNFNNRPTELFRSCTPQADEAARNDVNLWRSQNELSLPGLVLPLKNISKCSPDTWKAVACTLQIRPCSRHSHANQICREVCLDVLSQCVDWTTISPEHTPEKICAALSPDMGSEDHSSCISLQNYLYPPENSYRRADGEVSFPCKGEPCERTEICTVNRDSASPYTCTPGCRLGEVSEYVVPLGTYVRIPIPNNPKGCLKICRCGKGGRLDDCQPLPCVQLSACWMGSSQQREHGVSFELECNTCTCFAGEIVCSRKQCEKTTLAGGNTAYTTLPCNCPPHYVPVCGRNGNTYPSACLAKCAGLTDGDIEYGACLDPCRNNPCPIGHKCVPDLQICLSLRHKPCQQYQCINGTTNCKDLPREPVCDVENKEYANSCLLAHSGARLAYRGPCLKSRGCRSTGDVCAINGKVYPSECAAWADFVSVDYLGPCMAVGLIVENNGDVTRQRCEGVKCAPLHIPESVGTIPPGACCPVCGGALKLLYSRKQVDRALYALQAPRYHEHPSGSPLSLRAMLAALERHVQVAQCTLRGFLSVEQDIFLLIQSTNRQPSELQLEACVREAEKIAGLVNRQSPRLVSELSLSSLTAATIVHTRLNSSSADSQLMITAANSFTIFTLVFIIVCLSSFPI